MGPYYDHIVMITRGLEPAAPGRADFGLLVGRLRAAGRIAALIWNRVKPRPVGVPMSLAQIPAGADWESLRYGRADRLDPLLR